MAYSLEKIFDGQILSIKILTLDMWKIEDKIYICHFIFCIYQNEVFLKSLQRFAEKLLV